MRLQIGREGKDYFLKILLVKMQICEYKRLEISCATAKLEVGKIIAKNHSVLCFQKLQKHKNELKKLQQERLRKKIPYVFLPY